MIFSSYVYKLELGSKSEPNGSSNLINDVENKYTYDSIILTIPQSPTSFKKFSVEYTLLATHISYSKLDWNGEDAQLWHILTVTSKCYESILKSHDSEIS